MMRILTVLAIVTILTIHSNCTKTKHGRERGAADVGRKRGITNNRERLKIFKKIKKSPAITMVGSKRSKYNDEPFDPDSLVSVDETEPYDHEIENNYATENTPILWKDPPNNKDTSKKEEEGMPPEGFQQGADELPSTVGPNQNIYGGFPINDVLGGFELPSPEALSILKLALKQHGPRNEYEAQLHHDLENWAFGYEHHALPEYDVKETPPFYVAMLQGLKMLQQNKKKPGCKQGHPGCGHMVELNDDQCNTLASNCMAAKPVTSTGFEEPCPWKIIEMLYGCKKPAKAKAPVMTGKPDGIEPPPPKPDAPEEALPEKEKKPGEEEKEEKPKPIPIKLEGRVASQPNNKLATDIKDENDDTTKADGPETGAKLQTQLGLLGLLTKQSNTKQEHQSRMDLSDTPSNGTVHVKTDPDNNKGVSIKVDTEEPSMVNGSSASTNDKTDTEFTVWSDWSHCSVTCGKGSLSRARSCLNWKCDGKVIDIRECNKQNCPEYLAWSQWSPCDSTCGEGRTWRNRKCSGIRCSGISRQEKPCFRDACRPKPVIASRLIKAVGAPWSDWSPCTAKCGFGVQIRKRDCKRGNCRINTDLVQTKTCLRQSCDDKKANRMAKNVQQACMYIHNSYRPPHGSGELEWSDDLAEKASTLAKTLAQSSMTNIQVRKYEEPGTSIMVLPVGDTSDLGIETACVLSAKGWYGEQKDYNFNEPHLTDNNRHFTQMIWKASKRAGFGTAKATAGKGVYFVAMYDPAGNQDSYVGFRKNALPIQGENITQEVKRMH